MSYLNDTVPADNEAVKRGATRLRELKTALNTVIGKVFSDSGNFLTKWVLTSMLADGAVTADQVANASITGAKLATGALSADTTGRSKMADGFLTSEKLAPGFLAPSGSVPMAALVDGLLSADATGRAKMADGFVTLAKVASGVAKIAVGQYVGSNSGSVAVAGLAFPPDVVLIVAGPTKTGVGIAFRSEAVSGTGPIHPFWGFDSLSLGSPYATAIQWQADGFVVVPHSFTFSTNGTAHSYIALKA
jgi:hypothetical protein